VSGKPRSEDFTMDANPKVSLRTAAAEDAEQIAALHVDSWRRNYRGAYADAFLDGDVTAERRAVWSQRLSSSTYRDASATILAEQEDRLAGFIHVVFDHDRLWGSLVDNLHVVHDQRRMGIGSRLLSGGAQAIRDRAIGTAMYLWVLQQNTRAQAFYRAQGGTCVETAPTALPGGVPGRLNGTPFSLRMAWLDVRDRL
jgi:ribosomal protein S18 acetylase RimI-like enzyme